MTSTRDPALTGQWRRASKCDTGGQCVEVARAEPAVAVRDSKNPGRGYLVFSPQAWTAFTRRIKDGTRDT